MSGIKKAPHEPVRQAGSHPAFVIMIAATELVQELS
jgi:hypothetical protein